MVIDFFISWPLAVLRDAVLNGLLQVEVVLVVDGHRGIIVHKGLKRERFS